MASPLKLEQHLFFTLLRRAQHFGPSIWAARMERSAMQDQCLFFVVWADFLKKQISFIHKQINYLWMG